MPQPTTPPNAGQDAEIQELKKITEELKAVNANTGSSWTAFWRGMLSGGGAIVGSIVTIILIGIILSVMGIIPGLKTIAADINAAIANIKQY
jgi:hypothetical protein